MKLLFHFFLKLLLTVSFLLAFAIAAKAQKNGSLKGLTYDSIAKREVTGATIALLRKKDSSLVSFTMSDNKGLFSLGGLAAGDYRLLLTHVNYHSRSISFSVTDSNKDIDLGRTTM